MTIGERIRARRKELGLTQEELAIKLGNKSRASVCTVEKDKEDLTTTRIRQYAEALETTPALLMGWTEAVEQVSKEIERQMKPITDFLESHELDVPNGLKKEIDKLAQEYEPREILRAFRFLRAYLESSPERQQIVLDILQSHQGGS